MNHMMEVYEAVINRPFVKGFTKWGEPVLDRRHEAYLRDIECYDSFLEVGAGEARSSLYLSSIGKDVIAIDHDDPPDEYWNDITDNIRAQYIVCDFMIWPFDQLFDCVFAAEVLEHIKDWKPFLEKMLSLAVKCVVFTTPVERGFWDPGHVNFFKGDEFDFLSKYGDVEIKKLYTKEKDKELNQQCFYVKVIKAPGVNNHV